MKNVYFLFLYFLFMISFSSFSQEKRDEVRLIEEKLRKRTIIYIQNDAETAKSVFLKINPTGYRRSAQRPIIKMIPPKSKVQMCILIPLTDVPSSYTYQLIVNDELENINTKRGKELKEGIVNQKTTF